MREIFSDIVWDRKVFVFAAAVMILTVLGPFNTDDDLTFALRLFYFTVLLSGIGFFMHALISAVLKTQGLGRTSQAWRVVIGAIVTGVPGLAVFTFVDGIFRPPLELPDHIWELWGQISVIAYAIGVVEYIEWGEDEPLPEPPLTAFHKRLPEALGRDIVSLTMMDHYVEVTTTEGKHMILMRFSDALRDLEGFPGLRIHRSHYVAERHITGLRKSGNKQMAQLSDGRALPVSKTYFSQFRERLPKAVKAA